MTVSLKSLAKSFATLVFLSRILKWGLDMLRKIYFAPSSRIILVLLCLFGSYSTAFSDELPESLAGRWVIASHILDGKELPKDKVLVVLLRPGTKWKLFDDGTGEVASTDIKYSYSKKKTSFSMTQKSFLGTQTEILKNADVSKDGDKLILETTFAFGSKLKLVI